jgi:8-oxo-dGTP diphosphatase
VTVPNDSALTTELRDRLVAWQPDLVGTLVFVRRPGSVLLIHKRRGHGAGRITGPGGKLERGEDALTCARRETLEEVGVEVRDAVLAARLRFVERHGEQWLGHAFVASRFHGTPVETDEARPEWFASDALPFEHMWQDNRVWLPRVLSGESVEGDFLFDAGVLVAHNVRTVGRVILEADPPLPP